MCLNVAYFEHLVSDLFYQVKRLDTDKQRTNKMYYELRFKTVKGQQRAYYRSAQDGKWFQVSMDTAMMIIKEHYTELLKQEGVA